MLLHFAWPVCAVLASLQDSDGKRPTTRAEWPDYRGPRRDGHAPEQAKLPLTWSNDKNVTWRTPIRGVAWSSPVIAAGLAWLTSAKDDGSEHYVIAVDVASGKVVHDEKLWDIAKPAPKHELNSYASPSPVLAGGRVFVHFGSYGSACIDTATRKVLWQRRDLVCDHIVGPGSSPIAYDDLFVFHVDGGDVQYLVALDQATGATRWKTKRSVDFRELSPDERKAYSTPILVTVDGETRLLSAGAEAVYQYEAATGREVWRYRYRGYSMSARPIAIDGVAYLTTAFNRPRLLALDLSGEGDVSDRALVWEQKRNVPTMPSPVLDATRIYMSNDAGIASCLDRKTGERRWLLRLDAEVSASPLLAQGRVYFFDREGRTTVLAASDELTVLARNELGEGDGFMASPAVVDDAFLLRSKRYLYRIEEQ